MANSVDAAPDQRLRVSRTHGPDRTENPREAAGSFAVLLTGSVRAAGGSTAEVNPGSPVDAPSESSGGKTESQSSLTSPDTDKGAESEKGIRATPEDSRHARSTQNVAVKNGAAKGRAKSEEDGVRSASAEGMDGHGSSKPVSKGADREKSPKAVDREAGGDPAQTMQPVSLAHPLVASHAEASAELSHKESPVQGGTAQASGRPDDVHSLHHDAAPKDEPGADGQAKQGVGNPDILPHAHDGVTQGNSGGNEGSVEQSALSGRERQNDVQHGRSLPVSEEKDTQGTGYRSADDIRLLASSPRSLEIGVGLVTHGYVRVRAELDPEGGLQTVISTASAGAVKELTDGLKGLSAYLAQEDVRMQSISVRADPTASAWNGEGRSSGEDKEQQPGRRETQVSGRGDNGIHLEDAESTLLGALTPLPCDGRWLSVRA